jgi:hypothetical protein
MNKLGQMFQTAEGHASYEIEEADAEQVYTVADRIEQRFGFEPTGLPVVGVDSIHIGLRRQAEKITVGWDNWSGLFVMADDAHGNTSVEQIAEYLESIQTELHPAPAEARGKA